MADLQRWFITLVFLALLCALWRPGAAQAATLTFDGLPPQPANGLSFNGVTFGFQVAGVDSSAAVYGAAGPGALTFVDGSVLSGPTEGILTLDFTEPTAELQFGVSLETASLLVPGFSVELFDTGGWSLGVIDVVTVPLVSDSESFFSYRGVLLSRAVIAFNEASAPSFAMDNLGFESMPEPGTLLLFGSGLAGWALRRKWRTER